MESPFEILGVDPDADDADIVDAYRDRVKEVHPDQGGSVHEFRMVQTAYERIEAGYQPGDPVPDPDPAAGPEPAADDEADEPAEEPAEPPEPDGLRVEYLDYEAIVDQGWSLDDPDLFEAAADADLDEATYGEFYAAEDQPLLEAAEDNDLHWPFACRGGACTNCAVAVVDGEMPSPASHVLPPELFDKGIRLSCISAPVSDDMQVVFNMKHLPEVGELLLPASRFEQARSSE
ncbi:ferredoxin Fer [Halomicroarcula sp. GCM10025324]|uniref:ferredoxin Fer n=1 Tax=Haloarcula TaxID=2237 RepID=UPI0023E8DDBF|nr:ferredoxin Fer [Halomicroarcula sp. ZS-22-S1]